MMKRSYLSAFVTTILCVLTLCLTGCPRAVTTGSIFNSTLIAADGSPISGVLGPAKVDYYRFHGVGGAKYLIETDSNIDLTVSVLSSNGVTLLEHQTDGAGYWTGNKVMFLFDADVSRDYYVVVQGAGQVFDTRYYTLTVTPLIDDHGDTAETATPVTVDGPAVDGNMLLGQGADPDYFGFNANAGTVYSIRTFGYTHVALFILGPGGYMTLASAYGDYSTNQTIPFAPQESGVYYAVVEGWEPGDYQLSITTTVTVPETSDYGNTADGAASVVPDGNVFSGALGQDDVDYFSFHASAGTLYYIQTIGALDTVATLYDTDKVTVLTFDDDSGQPPHNAALYFYAPTDGTYYVQISSYTPSQLGAYDFVINTL